MENIPFIVHESNMARMERTNKRLWILCILLVLLLLGTNVAWAIYGAKFMEEEQEELEIEVKEFNAFISEIGDINNSKGDPDDENPQT